MDPISASALNTEFSLQDFASLFSQEVTERPSSGIRSEYYRLQSLSRRGEVDLSTIFGKRFISKRIDHYLPYYRQKEVDEYTKKLSQFVERASGINDEDNVDYKEMVARCMGLRIIYSKLAKLELTALNAWIMAYKELKKQCKNRDARATLKPVPPSQSTIFSEIQKLEQKIEAINGTLADQGPAYGTRRDLGGWTSIKTAGTDMETNELLWHGAAVQPKSELTNQIWPKSRMLLSIVSKMSKEGRLSKTDRGKLKDLILDSNPKLLQILHEYEASGNQQKLYSDFIKLAKSMPATESHLIP